MLLACLRPALGPIDVLLDIAPTQHVTPMLGLLGARTHVRLDLGADNRLVDVLASITALPLADDSVDFLVCYHVLEHVPDDRQAMAELARVLRPGGVALLQVPWRPDVPTDEDPSAPVEVRLARFGQADHVRYYGDDFEDRLVAAGLSLQRVTPRSLLGEPVCALFRIGPDETVWVATSGAAAPIANPTAEGPTGLTRALDFLVTELATQQSTLTSTRAALERSRRRVRVLESRLAPVLMFTRRLPGPLQAGLRRRLGSR